MKESQIIGICRFAFLGRGDWVGMRSPQSHDAARLDEQAEWLFHPDRMARRLFTLERICLASVAAQTDRDFRFLVLTSTRLPARHLEQLDALCARIPQVELLVSAETEASQALRPTLLQAAEASGRPALQFRLDDDDAVAPDFVANLRRIERGVRGLPRYALSFPRGLSVICYGTEPPSFWKTRRPFTGAALAARLTEPGRSIFAFNHFDLPRRMIAITEPDAMGHFVTRWDMADSARRGVPGIPWGYEPLLPEEFQRAVAADFPFLSGMDWGRLGHPAGSTT
ncbi:glycosyltransferase [Paracoccus shandongensis]|uniref:glycosyltransferase n=1 Tax=Paracoccus shandongensis TaxID=2816048 RepID=UPI001A8C1ABE|nr:glycosyltransferase [Paracoccus shandongensis]